MGTIADVWRGILDITESQRKKMDRMGFGEVYKVITDQFINEDCAYTESNCSFLKQNYNLDSITITDIEIGDSYFIFSHGSNSIVQFKIKECPNWLFAIWWEPGIPPAQQAKKNFKPKLTNVNYIIGSFFAQYIPAIDKFKPSRSKYCVEIRYDLKDIEGKFLPKPEFSWSRDYLRMVGFIHAHPALAFYRQWHGADFNYEYVTEAEAEKEFAEYIKDEIESAQAKEDFRKEVLNYYKDVFLPALGVEEYRIVDRGDCVSPRYEIYACLETTFEPEDIPEVKPWGTYALTFHPDSNDVANDNLDDYDIQVANATSDFEKWEKETEKRYEESGHSYTGWVLDPFFVAVPAAEYRDPKTWLDDDVVIRGFLKEDN